MKKLLLSLLIVASALAFGADNEIFVEQAGATANIDLEQLGSGNIIGGATAIFWWGLLGWVEFTGVKDKLDKEYQEELTRQIRDEIAVQLLETKTGGVVRAK